MKTRTSKTASVLLCSTLFLLAVTGCGGSTKKMIHGTVSCGGEKATDGYICFVPVEGTVGPVSSGTIVDGEYRIEDRDGVPVGKHRVEVSASKKNRPKGLFLQRCRTDDGRRGSTH